MKRGHLFEWGIFLVVLLGFLHFKIGFGEMPLWLWGVVGAVFVAVLLFEFVFDSIFERLLELVGLKSGRGPLVINAQEVDEELVIDIRNDGSRAVSIHFIDGTDHRDQKVVQAPIPPNERYSRKRADRGIVTRCEARKVAGKGNLQIGLSLKLLQDLNCKQLMVMDGNAKDWPVIWL